MAERVPSVENFRRFFYDYLKKEDDYELNVMSEKRAITIYERRVPSNDPWLDCFFFNDNDSRGFCFKYSTWFASSKNITNDQILDLVSDCAGITDEELNRCKAAMRREVRSRHIPDLSSDPERLQNKFLEESKKSRENIKRLKRLWEQIDEHMDYFKIALNGSLEALEPLSTITTTSDTTVEAVATNITKMRCMIQDSLTQANYVLENLVEAMQKFEQYQEFDENMDRDLFILVSHFFPNLLIPRAVQIRGNGSE